MEEKVNFKFYSLVDPRDQKIKYIGRTVNEKNRLRNHIYEARKNNRNKRERWINHLLKNDMKPILNVLYSVTCTLEEAISIEKSLVKCLRRQGYDLKNSEDNYLGAVLTGRPVYQYSLDRKFVKRYPNANQAYIQTGIKDCNISRCCKNPNSYGAKTAGNYFWSFNKYDMYPYELNRKKTTKKVSQYDLEGNLINTFESARIADQKTGVSYKAISEVVNDRRKSAGGFIWKIVI